MELISLSDVLTEMKSGNLFKIKFVSYDKKRKTGGHFKEFQAKLNIKKNKKNTSPSDYIQPERKTKNPNHFKNATRSLKIFVDGIDTGNIKKCHIFLITEFNGKKVYQ